MSRPCRSARKSGRRRGHRLSAESLEPRLALASYTVTSLADSGPGTLRSLIEQANSDPAADEISFGKLTGAIALQSSLPTITTDLKISATRPVTIDAKGKSAIFGVDGPGLTVSLQRLTLVNARSTESGATLFVSNWQGTTSLTDVIIRNSRVNSRYISAAGGAIANMAGSMTLTNCTISGCVANGADTDYGVLGARGGAIYSNDNLFVSQSSLRNNEAIGSFAGGGGIYATGSIWVEETVISGNAATGMNGRAGDDGANGKHGGKGIDGQRGAPGEDGQWGGEGVWGEAGAAGDAGGNGGHAVGGGVLVEGGSGFIQRSQVTDNSAVGGNGGAGGRGGNGGNGGAGGQGGAAGPKLNGRTGRPGEKGLTGSGGYPGAGGNGGSGGVAYGGGIAAANGTGQSLYVENTSVLRNDARGGKLGIGGQAGRGGTGRYGVATALAGSAGSAAESFGGGIWSGGADVEGALNGTSYELAGRVSMSGSTVSQNTVTGRTAGGGGIASVLYGMLEVSMSTIAGNRVTATGHGTAGTDGQRGLDGGWASTPPAGRDGFDAAAGSPGTPGSDGSHALGGGIYNAGRLTMWNSTIRSNSLKAADAGSGGDGGVGGNGGVGNQPYKANGVSYPAGRMGSGGAGGRGGDGGAGGNAEGAGIYKNLGWDATSYGEGNDISGNTGVVGKGGAAGLGGAGGKGRPVGVRGADGERGGNGIFTEGDMPTPFQ